MKKNYLNKNTSFFKVNAPFIYETIKDNKSLYSNVKISKINQNPLNFIIQNTHSHCYLNSLQHMDMQMKKRINQIDDDVELLIVFGFECGYFSEKILSERPLVRHIIIIEPCLQLFRQVIENRDITGIFKKDISITIVLNQDRHVASQFVSHLISQNRQMKIQYLAHTTYLTIFEDYYEDFMKHTRNLISSRMVNLTTNSETLHRYAINVMKNQKCNYLEAELIFKELKKLNCPAIIVSAGPSLNKNMNQLLEYKSKAFIVAVGTAIRILHENGIEPHLRVAMDGFPSETIFKDIDTERIPLLYSEKIHWEVLENYKGPKYRMIHDVDYLSQYFCPNEYICQMRTRSGYSVANTTHDLLSQIGFKNIILMGQDLCYTKDKLYADGALENQTLNFSENIYSKEQNIYGEEVYTSVGFVSMRSLFEVTIQEYPETKVINATEGGISIYGAENMTLTEATANLEKVEYLSQIENHVNNEQENIKNKSNISNYIKFFRELELIFLINNQRIDYLKSVSEYVDEKLIAVNIHDFQSFENKLHSFNEEMNSIDLYKVVINPSLSGMISNLYDFYSYNGVVSKKKIESLYNSVLAETTEIQRFAFLLNELKGELENIK
ncbi:MAG: hypothetical protein CVV02_00770 [Firmicutes bacterium HGW-Firmicutes-7]|nr:MAG: hypothetical protein CVV02_00770 [Firmicutes bacterium HGW-Firmicutes-7]